MGSGRCEHMNTSLITLDTLDDRREIWLLLHRLSPRRRVAYLAWCCEQVKGKLQPVASSRMAATIEDAHRSERADDRLTNEGYGDLISLGLNFGFDLGRATAELVSRGRAI